VKQNTKLNYKVNIERIGTLMYSMISCEMFFEFSVLCSYVVTVILSTLLTVNNRGANHLILRRLGVKEWRFWMSNYVFVFLPNLIQLELAAIIWHYTGILPFSGVTLDFAMFIHFLLAVLLSAINVFLSALMRN